MHGRTYATYPSCPGKGTAAPDKATVLLVEDDAIVRAWVGLALTDSEFSVGGEAPTMADGLELVSRRRGDLLLVDHRLTDGFGTELIREVRRRGNRTTAVVIAARAERELNEAAAAPPAA